MLKFGGDKSIVTLRMPSWGVVFFYMGHTVWGYSPEKVHYKGRSFMNTVYL